MIKSNFGRVVAVSAKTGLEITPGKFAYSVSKSAVINLIQTIAEENKELNLTANVIAPVIIDTPANRESMSNSDFNKWTSLEDIAETILFLISDAAKTFRGNVIKMYGNV
jgi:NAD(P)-dependent dehydrogenase (short-subunit alcohol dehydrogenase family)